MAEELSIDFELAAAGGTEDRGTPSLTAAGPSASPTAATSLASPRSPAPGEPGSAASTGGTSTLPSSTSTPHDSPSSVSAQTFASARASPMTPAAAELVPSELATPLEDDEERLDAFYGGEPLRYRTVDNILSEEPVPEVEPRLCSMHAGEPTTHVEAHGDPAWRKAMEAELESVERNRTWELVDPLAGHCPITLK